MEKFEILYSVLKELHNEGILDKCVLIGSWCQDFYRSKFENSFQIPLATTTDADLLIPKRIKNQVDVAGIMKKVGFDIDFDNMSGLMIFRKDDFKFEFLTDAGAKSEQSVHKFSNLKINAQELRYMTIPQKYNYVQQFRDIQLRLPEPEAFTLHKVIVSARRRNLAKRDKDVATAAGLLKYFATKEQHVKRLHEIYNEMIPAWRKTIDAALEKAGLYSDWKMIMGELQDGKIGTG
ncbi:MAG: hypothetical protein LBB56_01640 [Chitinispirillales bacterium]|nr:hypothetical protein [Chitinispirillales bacterium]